jgi:uncharacterized membrane protein SpoIIM required for sporulation
VDIDRFIARNQSTWARLDGLCVQARQGLRRLSPAELDELVQLYQRASAHLSYARVAYRDPALTGRLTTLVAEANAIVYGRRAKGGKAIARFFAVSFPAAVWDSRRFVAAAAALLLVPAFALAIWMAHSDRALDVAVPRNARDAYTNVAFEQYYSSEPAGAFSTHVLVNNIQVSIAAFALGALLCVPAALLLFVNGAQVGVIAGLFATVGGLGKFFGLILPHGLLELTSVCIAGGAGFRIGWAIIAPGDRTRANALAEEGRRSVVIILGLMAAFTTAGIIEGFVTPSHLPTVMRVGIGVVVEVAFLTYIYVQGRAAAAQGLTGVLGERPLPVDEPPAWRTSSEPAGGLHPEVGVGQL